MILAPLRIKFGNLSMFDPEKNVHMGWHGMTWAAIWPSWNSAGQVRSATQSDKKNGFVWI